MGGANAHFLHSVSGRVQDRFSLLLAIGVPVTDFLLSKAEPPNSHGMCSLPPARILKRVYLGAGGRHGEKHAILTPFGT